MGLSRTRSLVLCDLDDTIGDRSGAYRRWAAHFCDVQALGADAYEWLCRADADGQRARPSLFAELVTRFEIPSSSTDVLRGYSHSYLSFYEPCPGAVSALAVLRRAGCKVAIVTNGSRFQELKARRLGILGAVDALCISDIVGSRKPDCGIFEAAAQRCGLPLAGWMVGDSPHHDIRGGDACGMNTAWLRRDRTWPLVDAYPTITVDTLARAVDEIVTGS